MVVLLCVHKRVKLFNDYNELRLFKMLKRSFRLKIFEPSVVLDSRCEKLKMYCCSGGEEMNINIICFTILSAT